MAWSPSGGGSNGNAGANVTSIVKAATTARAVGDIVNAAVYFDTISGATGAVLTDQLGNTYVRQTSVADTPNTAKLETFLCVVTVAGTPTVTAQFNPTPGTTVSFDPSLAVDPFTGSDAASVADGTGAAQLQTAPTTATDATSSGAWTTSTNGGLLYTATVATATGLNPGAAGTGFTALQTSPGIILKTAYKTQATAGPGTAGLWTAAVNNNHLTAAHVVTPAAGGATVLPGKGDVLVTGFAPSVFVGPPAPGVGVVTITGFAPTVLSGPRRYTLPLGSTENPLSDGGKWVQGGTDGLDWTNVSVEAGITPHRAVGHQVGASFTDGNAVINGPWANDQYAIATVYSEVATQNDNFYQEVELRFRSAISAHSDTGYEVAWKCSTSALAYLIVVRWNGALGGFTYIARLDGAQYGVQTGDVVTASISGNTIKAWKNGTLLGTFNTLLSDVGGTLAAIPSGSPGLGFNLENGNPGAPGTNNDYGFTAFEAGDAITPVIQPGKGDVIVTGFAPTVNTGPGIQAGLGVVTLTGYAPNVTTAPIIRPGVGDVTLTGFAPTLIGAVPVIVGGGGNAQQRRRRREPEFRSGLLRALRLNAETEEDVIEPQQQPKPQRKRKVRAVPAISVQQQAVLDAQERAQNEEDEWIVREYLKRF